MMTITLDGVAVAVPPGVTLLQAVRLAGGDLPTLCHSPRMSFGGHCRLCLVAGPGGYLPACHTLAQEGGVYEVDTPALLALRRAQLQLILSRHPLTCGVCPAAGACQLQEIAARLGVDAPLAEPLPLAPDLRHPLITLDPALCIACGRCVEACTSVQGCDVLGLVGRGGDAVALPAGGRSLEQAGCVSCGQCLLECPSGAIRPASPAVEQPERLVATTCGYCAVGCRLTVAVANERILWSEPDPDGPANRGHACVKGRFGLSFAASPERLQYPLLRQPNGALVPVPWAEALDFIAARLGEIRARHGADAFGMVASARCTNEENFIFQKFARRVMGTNSVDNCARVCHSPSAFALGAALGTGAATNCFDDLEQAELILLVGANPTSAHPVLGARLKQALLKGCRLVVLDPRRTELAALADLHLPVRPGANVAVLNAMQQVILAEGLWDRAFVAAHAEGLAELEVALAGCTPEWAAPIARLPAELIRRAARLYAGSPRAMILWGLGITESCQGTLGAFALVNLAILTGSLGRPGVGANPIRGQNNVQGACDMGALPNVFSDYRSVTDPAARAEHLACWGAAPPERPGLKIPEMLEAARGGALKALYVVGQDLAQSDPHTAAVEEALANLELLVVQDIFPTLTARFAHVVLPAAAFLEKEGSFVNSDRRVQRVRRVVAPPGQARADGEIVHDLAARLGVDLGFAAPAGGVDAALVMAEIARLSPNWRGISHARLEALGSLQWPCPAADHPGTPILHVGGILRGKARLTPTPWRALGKESDVDYPLLLTTGRVLHHYNVGTMTRRTPIVRLAAAGEEWLRLHPEDAARLGLADGDWATVTSRHGQVTVRVGVGRETGPGVVFMAFHFPETRTNLLVGADADEATRCPAYKTVAVRVERGR